MAIDYLFKSKQHWFGVPHCHGEFVLSSTYYHFFFSVLIPLLDLARQNAFYTGHKIYIESCGGFDRLLNEVVNERLPIEVIPDREVLSTLMMDRDIGFFILDSWEAYWSRYQRFCVRPIAHDSFRIRELSTWSKERFEINTSSYDILVINRKNTEEGHGANTRRISNCEEIVSNLSKEWYVKHTTLEGKSLRDQIELFHNARCIVCQHGSALANLIWCRPFFTALIEIVPEEFTKDGWQYFQHLSQACLVPRIEIPQKNPFDPVDPTTVIKSVKNMLSS